MNKIIKKSGLALLGASLLALPLALPNTAHADGLRVNLNLGAPVYYRPTPVAVRYVPAPAPVRVTNYYPRPVYQRVVYRPRTAWWAPHHGWRHGYNRVAYRW